MEGATLQFKVNLDQLFTLQVSFEQTGLLSVLLCSLM
jgi:hypothetical protein